MATAFPDLFAALAAPFQPGEVKTRQQAGRRLSYITARTVANRLDSVLGPENWWDSYLPMDHSVLCTLTIRLPDGTTLSKQDAGGYAGMADQGDDDKSGYSDAFKRAAVKFGVGRLLYGDGVPEFVRERCPGEAGMEAEAAPEAVDDGRRPVQQPRPRKESAAEEFARGKREAEARNAGGQGGGFNSPPRSGRALFAWVKDQEQRHEVGLLQYMNKWGKLQDFPARMVDWDAEQVARAYQEAVRKLQEPRPDRNEAMGEALAN